MGTDMSAWSETDLATIGEADEIEVAPDRADRTRGPWVPIWVVRVGDELYVRSFRGPTGSWYRRAREPGTAGSGSPAPNGPSCSPPPIRPPGLRSTMPTAAKYGRYGSSYITPMTSDSVAGTTLRLTAPTE